MSRSVTSIHSSLHASYQTLELAPFFCPGSASTGESWPLVHLCYGQPFTSTTSQDRQWLSSGLIAHRICHSRSSGTFKTIQDLCIWGIVGWRQSCLCSLRACTAGAQLHSIRSTRRLQNSYLAFPCPYPSLSANFY